MTRSMILFYSLICISMLSYAQLDTGSDGSDGVLNITQDTQIDLGEAATGTWNMASPVAGKGVYDPEKWVVVFKYESVNIDSDATLRFKNHPANPPVIWLVQGDVVIDGLIDISGQNGGDRTEPLFFAIPGPGGFRGGHRDSLGARASAGMGPGGAHASTDERSLGTGGSYATLSNKLGGEPGNIYGNPAIFPLIGGSGGEGGLRTNDTGGGGAGGGAILIASNNNIMINGVINANGGSRYRTAGSGSGGAIKLIANRVVGSGQLTASGQANWEDKAGDGRIRIESNENLLTSTSEPPYTVGDIVTPLKIVADEATPTLTPVSLDDQSVPGDPHSALSYPNVDMTFSSPGLKLLTLEAGNIPTDATVTVRVVRQGDLDSEYQATFLEGDRNLSRWQTEVELRNGHFTIQAMAHWE